MYVSNLHITLIFIYLIYSKHLWTKKLCWSFCTNDRSWNHFFWVLRDSRTGISAIFNRRAYRLNDFFSEFSLYQLFGHPMNFNLNQSDEKSDQPGILGLDDPFGLFKMKIIVTILNSIITVETHSESYQHHAQGHLWYWDDLRMNRLFFRNMNNDEWFSDWSDVECSWVWCWSRVHSCDDGL